VNYSALFVCKNSKSETLTILDFIGAAVWLVGFLFEVFADFQLSNFLKQKNRKTKFLQSGLWALSRHPNYFGESLVWFGIYLISCSVKNGYFSIFSPIFITFLVRYVSGVPLIEKKYKNDKEFQNYAKRVNIFIPGFPK